ncbi:MAG TPA: lipoyl(octanoyl) transferase LipB [Gemmatimonadales bacterium]|jgi:lipoate-protein ligase B|nr:lipoyl(octanoyl) transferase LipB [Gemmatimonadales bacterium]
MNAPLVAIELGRRHYGEVLELQRSLCRRRAAGELGEDLLLLVEHEPVVTLGRSTRPGSLALPRELLERRGLEIFEVERGGDVTLHAPGQLVGYPILDLGGWRRDLHWYLRQLEESLIRGLGRLDVAAERNPGKTGVWTGGCKIASIGIHVKQWVTMHGFALNVTTDLALFDFIVPCGIAGVRMTSVAQQRGGAASSLWGEAQHAVVAAFAAVFEREIEFRPSARMQRSELQIATAPRGTREVGRPCGGTEPYPLPPAP